MRTADGHLVDQCLKGDHAAFGLLVDTYRSGIYALAYSRLQNFHDAEDLTQEAFIKAYRNLRALKRGDNFKAWMYSITSNLCKNFLRSKSRRIDNEFIDDQSEGLQEPVSPDKSTDDPMHETLHEALAALPDMYREVLTLHYLGEMKSREIAQFLGTSKNTIDTRLRRAKSHLKEEMLTMMTGTFETHRLQPSFTFRIVEMIKETKMQGAPNKASLPYGVSIATGLIIALLSLTVPHSLIYPIGEWIGSALPSKTQVPEVGVIPVDTIEVTDITILSSEKGDGDFGQKPKPENQIKAFGAGTWTKKKDMPAPRGIHVATVVDGKVYVIGGWRPAGPALATVEVYDPVKDEWEKKADMPTARYYFAVSAVNGKIYAMGGIARRDAPPLATVEEYDPVTDTWTKKADMPTPRGAPAAAAVDGKIYVMGAVWINEGIEYVPTVEMYDPEIDKWTKRMDMPTPRGAFAAIAVDGKIYAMGGEIGLNRPPTSIVEAYDPVTDTWSRKADMLTPNKVFSADAVTGKIYVFGGWDGFNSLSVVEEYDTAIDTWTRKQNMETPPRGDLTASAIDGKLYVIGGGAFNPLRAFATVEEFDPQLPTSVNPAGKLATTWGEVKAAR